MCEISCAYERAVTERDVPFPVLLAQAKQIHGKPEDEQLRLKETFTKIILEEYPVKEEY